MVTNRKKSKIVNVSRDITVYLNLNNDIAIRQRKDWPEERDDPFIFIPIYRVRALIERLDEILIEAQDVEKPKILRKLLVG